MKTCQGCKNLNPYMVGGDSGGNGKECDGHYCSLLQNWVDLKGVDPSEIKVQCSKL